MRNPRWSRQPEADDRAGTGVEAHGTGSEAPEVPAARSAQRVHVVAGAIPVAAAVVAGAIPVAAAGEPAPAAAGIIKAPQARERQDHRRRPQCVPVLMPGPAADGADRRPRLEA